MEPTPPNEFLKETEVKPSFRKPSNDASGRRYRRHSPARGSDSSENERSRHGKHRQISSREDNAKFGERRKNDGRELQREYHNRHGKDSNSYMNSDREDKHNYVSSRHHRDLRGRDRGGRDDRRDRRYRSPENYKNDDRSYLKSTQRKDIKESYGSEDTLNRGKHDKEWERDRNKYRRETEDESKNKRVFSSDQDKDFRIDPEKKIHVSEDYNTSTKKYKLGHPENDHRSADNEKPFSKSKAVDNEKPDSTIKEAKGTVSKFTSGPICSSSSQGEAGPDLSAAKVAAMKAAELVNRNIGGGGLLSTDQKKKLLWGNKKSSATEESAGRWDVPLFSDLERQEKFNKLMGVKGDAKVEHRAEDKDDSLRAEKQEQLQMDLEKQYTAGLRRRDGRTVGLGL